MVPASGMSDDAVTVAGAALRRRRRVAVLTGAGISTDSGIPDFRGPDGLWTKDPDAEKYSTIQHYLSDPQLRERAWRYRMANLAWTGTEPGAHRAGGAGELGRLELLVTQNIDGLHLAAGSDPERVVEVHGSIRVRAACSVTGGERQRRSSSGSEAASRTRRVWCAGGS